MATLILHSVGIDVGTTTTQVIFSRLEVVNRAAVSQVPHYEFTKREILYESPVIFTPINFEGQIREDELLAFILEQYRVAGIAPETLESGAIIITGETSKARNARPTIMTLSEKLGNFVVATAGPYLESIIAGQGAGASEISQDIKGRVLNIDIGGGTSNYAIFENGDAKEAACLNIGGRLLELDASGKVLRVHQPAKVVCESMFGSSVNPMNLTQAQIRDVTQTMAQLVYEVAIGQPSVLAKKLMMSDDLPSFGSFQAVTISGGVGTCFYQPVAQSELFKYGDIGPLLAEALSQNSGMQSLKLAQPKQTIRATVIGAGAHTLSLSGSTIWLKDVALPIRNVPVIQTRISGIDLQPQALIEDWEFAIKQHDLDPLLDICALNLPKDLAVAYKEIQKCVEALVQFTQKYPSHLPLIIVARQDLGKVLGMLLQPYLQDRKLAVIDEVVTRDGDYIDIGKPLFEGEIVPVTIKSLAFPA